MHAPPALGTRVTVLRSKHTYAYRVRVYLNTKNMTNPYPNSIITQMLMLTSECNQNINFYWTSIYYDNKIENR